MRSAVFDGKTGETCEQMREKDKNCHNALRKLLKVMSRSDDPPSGLGKLEPLKRNLPGLWSKHISQKDRVIYKFDDNSIYIFALVGAMTKLNANEMQINLNKLGFRYLLL